ncbi:MFS transporter [Pigmentiphaga soli]|uniref:Uncharacterized MFS-type transporter GCM10023144_08960 n=1 Tax=Pigmentiphaga soli TaxID=1007095 RepID=A0ABP8GKE8_9BURK
MSSSSPDIDTAPRQLLRMTLSLFLSYLAVAMALPVSSVYVARELGLGNVLGGLAVGIAFLSTILTRRYAGGIADRLGGKLCMRRGLLLYAAASLICLAAGWRMPSAPASYAILIAGRLLLGLGESLALVGVIGWGIGLMGPARSGRVMALVGMGMYGAFAAGGPLGLALFHRLGFAGLMAVCAVLPLAGLLLVQGLPAVAPHPGQRAPFWQVMRRIWREGAVVCLQGVGFAALGAFISLLFISRGWPYSGFGLSCFGAGFVLMRLLCGHLPDRLGGTPVAIGSLAIEACGQYLLWLAPGPGLALLGALLTGLGCSMVFPAMGVDVVRRVPPQQRGTAVGGFAAFQDLAYGGTGPIAGLVADHYGYGGIFLVGGMAATLGLALAALGLRRPRAPAAAG